MFILEMHRVDVYVLDDTHIHAETAHDETKPLRIEPKGQVQSLFNDP
mgnify:CR=1 FL=1